MSKEKKIEEMESDIAQSGMLDCRSRCRIVAEELYCKGYSKQSEGEWYKASDKMPIYRCSVCNERNLFKEGNNVLSNYCPNCGARMGGE